MFNISKLKKMQILRTLINDKKDIFPDIDDECLQAFLTEIAFNAIEEAVFIEKYKPLQTALFLLSREEQIEICEKYYLDKTSIYFCDTIHTIVVGSNCYQYITA